MFRTGKVPVRSAKEPVRYPGHFFRSVATATPPIIAAITDKGAFHPWFMLNFGNFSNRQGRAREQAVSEYGRAGEVLKTCARFEMWTRFVQE